MAGPSRSVWTLQRTGRLHGVTPRAACAAATPTSPPSTPRSGPQPQPGEPATSELAARFRVCHRTVTKALAAPEPPPWKQPFKKQPPAYAASLDALLDTAPHLTARQLWEQLTDHTDLKVSYDTVSEHHKRRQQAQPRT